MSTTFHLPHAIFQMGFTHLHEHAWVRGIANPPTRTPGAKAREELKDLSKWWLLKGIET